MSKDKSLKDKAISIKGKKYVLVSDRVTWFNEEYPNGSIITELVSEPTSEMVIVRATVIPDIEKPTRRFTGYSQAVIGAGMVNTTAALENAETSAVGRALGLMGIGVIESIASADEMAKATTNTMKYATDKQINWIRNIAADINNEEDTDKIDKWIESVLTIPPQQIPIFKVNDAVNKLKQAGEDIKALNRERLDQVELDAPETLKDVDLSKVKKGMDKGEVPY